MIEYNDETSAKMREVAEQLLGTCKSLDSVLQEVFGDDTLSVSDFDILLLHELDDATMECQSCNWWCEIYELDDDQICDDCR